MADTLQRAATPRRVGNGLYLPSDGRPQRTVGLAVRLYGRLCLVPLTYDTVA